MPELTQDGFTTYYEDTGSGEAILLLPGVGADLQVWERQVPALAEHRRVIRMDNRGAGRSSAPNEPYTIDAMALDVIALLDHLDLDRTDVVGWSMGAAIAQVLAVDHPGRVRTLVLTGAFSRADDFIRLGLESWVEASRSNMPPEEVVRLASRMVCSPAFIDDRPAYDAYIGEWLDNPYAQSQYGFERQVQAVLAFQGAPGLDGVDTPTLILVGEDDQMVPRYFADELAGLIPGARLEVLPGGHSGFVEHPDEWNRAILDFLGAKDGTSG